jgi:hypothetical protein
MIHTIQIGTVLIQGECEIERIRVFHSEMYEETGFGRITINGTTYRGRLVPQVR